MPGAPQISGTDEDSSHFFHQPPPIEGINFGSQQDSINQAGLSDTNRSTEALRSGRGRRGTRGQSPSQGEEAIADDTDPPDSPTADTFAFSPGRPASPTRSSTPAQNPTPPSPTHLETPRRARFPEEPAELTKTYSAPQRAPTSLSKINGGAYDGEKDREPAAHRGAWQSFRNWMTAWKEDLGSPTAEQDVQDLIGDIGIDLQTIRKIGSHSGKKGKRHSHHGLSSLIAPSVMLARPGLGTHTESSSTVPTLAGTATGGSTAPSSGTATPRTARKLFGVGVDPHELSKALKKFKTKVAQGDSKHAKYVQAKAELAHRRNLVLLMVSSFPNTATSVL